MNISNMYNPEHKMHPFWVYEEKWKKNKERNQTKYLNSYIKYAAKVPKEAGLMGLWSQTKY